MRRALAEEVLSHLQAALRAGGLYPGGHPAISAPVRRIAEGLDTLLRPGQPIVLSVLDDALVLDELAFYDTDDVWRNLFVGLRQIGIESLTFDPGLDPDEISKIVEILSSILNDDSASLGEAWKRASIEHASYREKTRGESLRARAERTYKSALAVLTDLGEDLQTGRVPSTRHLVRVIDDLCALVLKHPDAMLGLTRLRRSEDFLYTHSINIAILSLLYGRHLELPPEELRRLGLGGLLHDLGEMRTPPGIRQRPGPLTSEESRVIQLHPELGAEILESVQGIHPDTRAVVLHHHVRFDRSGYPKVPHEVDVHPLADAIGLFDCYEALTTARPYKRPHHPGEAAAILRRLAGIEYAPELVDRFLDVVGLYPVGETVRLSTGEIGVVVARNPLDETTPVVGLVVDAAGNRLARPERVELGTPSKAHRRVAALVEPLRKGIDVARVLEDHLG